MQSLCNRYGLPARAARVHDGGMITTKVADRNTQNIRKGETYLSFTGRDADYVRGAAKKVGLSEGELVSKALLMFIDRHGVRGVSCYNGDAKFS
jgi:hypothetical protein